MYDVKVKVKYDEESETYTIEVQQMPMMSNPKINIYIEHLSTEEFSFWTKDNMTDEFSSTKKEKIIIEEARVIQ